MSTGDGAAQLLQVDLKLNRSALQSLATSLSQAWKHRKKVSPPVGLMHLVRQFKILKSHHDKWATPREMWSSPSSEGPVSGKDKERVTHLHPCLCQQFQLIPASSQAGAQHWPCCLLQPLVPHYTARMTLLICSHILRNKFVGCGGLWEAKRISTCIKVTPTMPKKKKNPVTSSLP